MVKEQGSDVITLALALAGSLRVQEMSRPTNAPEHDMHASLVLLETLSLRQEPVLSTTPKNMVSFHGSKGSMVVRGDEEPLAILRKAHDALAQDYPVVVIAPKEGGSPFYDNSKETHDRQVEKTLREIRRDLAVVKSFGPAVGNAQRGAPAYDNGLGAPQASDVDARHVAAYAAEACADGEDAADVARTADAISQSIDNAHEALRAIRIAERQLTCASEGEPVTENFARELLTDLFDAVLSARKCDPFGFQVPGPLRAAALRAVDLVDMCRLRQMRQTMPGHLIGMRRVRGTSLRDEGIGESMALDAAPMTRVRATPHRTCYLDVERIRLESIAKGNASGAPGAVERGLERYLAVRENVEGARSAHCPPSPDADNRVAGPSP